MKKKAFVVVGLGFGDEGKGLATDFLCLQNPDPLVIRFNGGQQAGHTVVTLAGKRHVFSNFGSGTLRGAPTYWSAYCTFSPGSFLKEYQALRLLGTQPQMFVDKLCPVTTHYDVLYNRVLENARGNSKHGSCGMGFGATLERHLLSPVKIHAQDLHFSAICQLKLNAVRDYYRQKLRMETGFDFDKFDHVAEDQRFMQSVKNLHNLETDSALRFVTATEMFASQSRFQTFIFEGAQGILLDMDFGFFPHMTRSNTCSKNALALVKEHLNTQLSDVEIQYVSRAYQTRHGQGPMMHENVPLTLINNTSETNVYNEHQGNFRVGPLDVDLLNYALQCDGNFSHGLRINLLVTCVDQLDNQRISFYKSNTLAVAQHTLLPGLLDFSFKNVRYSFSDCAENIGN